MKYLFLLAHPDDEAVAAGGTIRLLADRGDEVKVVLATKGEAGENPKNRTAEFKKSCQILGVSEFKILKFKDGEINNKQVWGSLALQLIEQVEEYYPDVVVTFDHSGWYFHLDHVGVSLAALRAVQRSKHKVQVLLFTLFHPPGIKIKWPYVYEKKLPVTHVVNVKPVLKQKVAAIKAHASQSMSFLPLMRVGLMNKEYFQLVLATRKGKMWFNKSEVFKKI
ncbi:MAG: PIG-L family deacetylase [Patescibacteria group bacterium]|nr:PIG-L family deacetylase [Patescibacteria group bacterium]